jgi:predicted PilT family ATPase
MTILACGVENVIGLKYLEDTENPNESQMIVIVSNESFPVILGREGKNIKLIAQLLNLKVDLKNLKDANFEGIEFEPIESFGNLNYVPPKYDYQNNNDSNNSYNDHSDDKKNQIFATNLSDNNVDYSDYQNNFNNNSQENFFFSDDLKELEDEFLSEINNVDNDKKDE